MATAKLFVKEGAHVFITGRGQKELGDAVKAIGSNVTSVQGDIANLTDLDRLYEAVAIKGRIDVVFANAGVAEFVPLRPVKGVRWLPSANGCAFSARGKSPFRTSCLRRARFKAVSLYGQRKKVISAFGVG